MGNDISYFSDHEVNSLAKRLVKFTTVQGQINCLRARLLKRERYFKSTEQLLKVLDSVRDLNSLRSRYQALVILTSRVHTLDARRFDGREILDKISYNNDAVIALLATRKISVSKIPPPPPITIEYQNMLDKIRLQPTEKATNDSEGCHICMEFKKTVMFDNCGHVVLCPKCALDQSYSSCIICREPSSGLRLVYL